LALPVGTTSRQIEWLVRWLLAAVVILGMLAWWWPGFRSWGTTAAGLVVALMLWLLWRTLSGERTVPGHPFHLVLVIPAAILIGHLALAGTLAASGDDTLSGELNMSMILQLALLSLGVMLSQSLLPRAARHVVVVGLCGAAMVGGPAAALVWGRAGPARPALAMLAFGGVGVWLSMLWSSGGSAEAEAREPMAPALKRGLRIGCVAVAVAAAGALTAVAPRQGLLTAGIVAVVLVMAGLTFTGGRPLLAAGGALGVGAVVVLTAVRWVREACLEIVTKAARADWFGQGEAAFGSVSAADSGLVVLAAVTGWLGAGCFVLGLLVCMGWLLSHARKSGPGAKARAIGWSAAAAVLAAALLSDGGLVVPAVTLAVALAWGLLPVMVGRAPVRRSGAWLPAVTVVVVLLAGLTPKSGLLSWMTDVFGGGDKFLHASIGLLLGVQMAWLMGAGRVWLGLTGIVLAALAGGGGELAQYLVGTRTLDMADWLCHAIGSAAAVGPYLLCMGARWAESPDARDDRAAADAYLRR
jgi:hypothetical protein